MSDGDLVRQALAGRTAAYGELTRRWSAPVLAFCHAKVGIAHAEDLAQESLLRGLRALGTLAEPEKFGPWLRGIALRVCLDWHKSKQNHQVSFGALAPEHVPEELLVAEGSGPEEIADRNEQLGQLMHEVQSLHEEYREVLLLYYYQDVTYAQLAEQIGVSSATVNARLTKARAMLRERLGALRG
jgi:RNA polymerase sigma-70 factor (ECF subfamily)